MTTADIASGIIHDIVEELTGNKKHMAEEEETSTTDVAMAIIDDIIIKNLVSDGAEVEVKDGKDI